MWVNNLPKVATQCNSGTTRESNRGPRVLIPSALTTKPFSPTVIAKHEHGTVKQLLISNIIYLLSLCNRTQGTHKHKRIIMIMIIRPWAFSTHQLATSWLILEGGSPSILARLERPAIYFNGFLFWCSALMLFCCMTVCRPLTARTDDRTHLCIA